MIGGVARVESCIGTRALKGSESSYVVACRLHCSDDIVCGSCIAEQPVRAGDPPCNGCMSALLFQ
jgi:hypothetical protein